MDGWAKLGAALGGAGGGDAAFMRGQSAAADIETKLARARMTKQEEMARTQFAQSLTGMGVDPAQAGSLASLMQGGQNIGQVFSALQKRQGMGMQSELWDRINGGQAPAEWGGLNQALAVLSGKPVQVTGQGGGVLYNRLAGPEGQAPVVTDVGQSMIQQRQAAAASSRASALRNAEQARLAGVKADAGGFAPKSAGGSFGRPSITLMDRMLGTVDEDGESVADLERQRDFMVWQADMSERDPRYRDPQFALAQFLRQSDTSTGVLSDGSGVPQRVNLDAPVAAAPMLPKGQYTEKDAADLIAAADRAIAAGKDRNTIEKMLRENLAQMGFSRYEE